MNIVAYTACVRNTQPRLPVATQTTTTSTHPTIKHAPATTTANNNTNGNHRDDLGNQYPQTARTIGAAGHGGQQGSQTQIVVSDCSKDRKPNTHTAWLWPMLGLCCPLHQEHRQQSMVDDRRSTATPLARSCDAKSSCSAVPAGRNQTATKRLPLNKSIYIATLKTYATNVGQLCNRHGAKICDDCQLRQLSGVCPVATVVRRLSGLTDKLNTKERQHAADTATKAQGAWTT